MGTIVFIASEYSIPCCYVIFQLVFFLHEVDNVKAGEESFPDEREHSALHLSLIQVLTKQNIK